MKQLLYQQLCQRVITDYKRKKERKKERKREREICVKESFDRNLQMRKSIFYRIVYDVKATEKRHS